MAKMNMTDPNLRGDVYKRTSRAKEFIKNKLIELQATGKEIYFSKLLDEISTMYAVPTRPIEDSIRRWVDYLGGKIEDDEIIWPPK